MCSASSGSVQMCGLPSPWSWPSWRRRPRRRGRARRPRHPRVASGRRRLVVVVVAGAVQLDARARVDEHAVEARGAHRVVEPALEPGAVDDEGVGVGEGEQLRGRRVEAVRALRGREELVTSAVLAHELAGEVPHLRGRRDDRRPRRPSAPDARGSRTRPAPARRSPARHPWRARCGHGGARGVGVRSCLEPIAY